MCPLLRVLEPDGRLCGEPPDLPPQRLRVSDQAAIALSQVFYSALADGYPADAALSEARKAIAAQGNPLEWGTPVSSCAPRTGYCSGSRT